MKHFKYINMHSGEEVRDIDAPDYVADKCGFKIVKIVKETNEFINNVVNWYFSGNWIKINDEDDYDVQATLKITKKDKITSTDIINMIGAILGVKE